MFFQDKCILDKALNRSAGWVGGKIIFPVGVQPFFDHPVRSALSPPHTSRAPGARKGYKGGGTGEEGKRVENKWVTRGVEVGSGREGVGGR